MKLRGPIMEAYILTLSLDYRVYLLANLACVYLKKLFPECLQRAGIFYTQSPLSLDPEPPWVTDPR